MSLTLVSDHAVRRIRLNKEQVQRVISALLHMADTLNDHAYKEHIVEERVALDGTLAQEYRDLARRLFPDGEVEAAVAGIKIAKERAA